ncbi:MAG: diaminopimelate dehydrogenase, partial [Bacteroidales bacterium]|nr:diaminopimelate dehydrogenase [Bacteroidales bacterium]
MKKISVAIVGYGNIGKFVVEALQTAPDMEIAGVVRRSLSEEKPLELTNIPVVTDIRELGKVDVAILSTPSRKVEENAQKYLAMGIHTVDSFDIHSDIWQLKQNLDTTAKVNQAVSIISAGWDPGSDSVVRALLQAAAPKGLTYTNFGPGMSMGHSVAAKAIEGVKDALSMTIPLGTGIHRRMVYIELKEGYDFDQVAAAIKADNYFSHDETHVM